MSKKISLTGIKPTGVPHFGNYFGAIKPALEMANSGDYEGYYFIADYHSLITVHQPEVLREYIYDVAATWLALGLDPSKVTLYQQSHIPEILELNWITSCFTAKGLMNRAHAYKALVQSNEIEKRDTDHGVNMGVYTYPILMACDILFLKTNVVPVGADQLQHIEIARDIASSFNHIYGDIFTLPEAKAQEGALVPGLDGRKMSKSYGNHIPLFLPEKKLKKTINKIATDSTAPEVPKDPNDSVIFDFYKLFASEAQIKELDAWYRKGIGWGEAKLELFNVANEYLREPREKYNELIADKSKIDLVLKEGAERVRPKAAEFLKEVKKAVGVIS
ncbi:tryptophan--tRNA ligase [Halobacteriovorax sp. JY17]|uniref:tryptophan--tRNA ligase n=1 Tax=Halobacteriovorax sp. JY17 TaxID=2014617 RepID=UPI000C68FACB|nr:tryptophan--tRNA ligase [Halobacteriovorax sp. JY17]PIK13904.1 MAG: tryptophan--tRNA ligase [Halobacteriovorax sp. JY17]